MTDRNASLSANRPTISDVARHCGLSKATVSKVVSLPPEKCPIAPSSRQRVLDAVAELGYRPSWQGRLLAKGRSQMIAVAYASPLAAVPRGVYLEIADHLDPFLSRHGYCPAFVHTKEGESKPAQFLSDQRFDGCLSLGSLSKTTLKMLAREKIPTVLINAEADASWSRMIMDDEGGTVAAMKHLLDLGHRRIVYNAGRAPNTHPSAIIRATTYQRCMHKACLTPEPPFLGTVDQFVDRLVLGPLCPTAILDFEHWTAIRVLQALWRRGVRVPQDVSLVTFNDTYPVDAVTPPLTTVALSSKEVSEKAVTLLLELIEQQRTGPHTMVIPERLVIRESTAPPRGE